MSSGEETITEGSDSADEHSGVVQASHHPIPTIEIEEICVGEDEGSSEEEEGEDGESNRDTSDRADSVGRQNSENEESVSRELEGREEVVVQEVHEESYDQTVPSDSPLESTEIDSSILEDNSDVLEQIPMDTRENESVTLEESITEFDRIEKQYDMLQEELGFSLSSEPTSEEQKWISPRKDVKESDSKVPTGDPEPSSNGSQGTNTLDNISDSNLVTDEASSEGAAKGENVTEAKEPKDISTTISKLTPTREIDLLKELELMEQEVSTMKKVVDEVEANVESRKAKIAELMDSSSFPELSNIGTNQQSDESKSVSEKDTVTDSATESNSQDQSVTKEVQQKSEDAKTSSAEDVKTETEDAKTDSRLCTLSDDTTEECEEPDRVTRIMGVTTTDSTTDDVDKEETPEVLNIAGVTASESTTDMEFPSSESDVQVNDIMTKSLSQNFDLVSLQSLQDNVKLEPEIEMVSHAKLSKGKTAVESRQRPTNLGDDEHLLTRDAPLASVESECDDELMRTSSSNASPDDPIGHKTDDSKDLEEEPDSTTSESLMESSVKSEVHYKKPYKSFKDTFPVHVSTIAHMTPKPPVLVPVPEPKKPEPAVMKPIPQLKKEQEQETSSKTVPDAKKRETSSEKEQSHPTRREPSGEKQKSRPSQREPVRGRPTQPVQSLGQKLKVEKHDGRPSPGDHGLKPVPREAKEKRSKSPSDLGLVPAAGGGLQGIGAMVAAAARTRSKLTASIEEDAIKRIDQLLSTARERREKRSGAKKEDVEQGKQDEGRKPKEESSPPAASGASTAPQSPPPAARAAVQEHLDALDQLVRESQAAADITLDESFINTRDRKKRKRRQSNNSDSSFTISTPSGSIKSCSSISEIEHSLGASLDKSNSNDLLGSSTDADVSLSIDQLVEDNSAIDYAKSTETTVISDKTLDQSQEDSHRESGQYQSANTTLVDNSNSEYYTPDVSQVEPMDTSEVSKDSPKPANRPKALDSRSTASDGKSLDSLDDSHSSPLYSPRRNLLDAKRSFFFEPCKPVSIDPSKVFNSPTHKNKKNNKNDNGRKDQDGNAIEVGPEEFENEKNANNAKHHGSPSKKKVGVDPELLREWKSVDIKDESPKKGVKGLDLKRDWQSLDSGSATSPTAGVPKTNVTNGDSDVFYTPGTSLKHPPIVDLCAENGLRKPTDARKRILPEVRKTKNDEQESARQAAREKARLKSDEELGLQSSPTRKAAYSKDDGKIVNGVGKDDTKDAEKKKSSAQDTSTKRSSGFFDHYPPLEPEIPCKVSIIGGSVHEAKTRSLQNKATAAAMADYLQSPQGSHSKTMKDKRTKSKSPMRAAETTPSSPPNLQKQDSREDKKESKEKRRSLLALLLPSKSVEKKEKEKKPEKEKKTPARQSKTKSPPIKKQEPKAKALKSPRSSTSLKTPATSEQPKKAAEAQEGQRTSVYEELGPVFEDHAFSEKKEGKKPESKKDKLLERIEQVAPSVSNENTIAPKLPPRATGETSLPIFINNFKFFLY